MKQTKQVKKEKKYTKLTELNNMSKQETNIWQEPTKDIIDPKKNWQETNSGVSSWEEEFEKKFWCDEDYHELQKKLKDFISKTISQAKEEIIKKSKEQGWCEVCHADLI